VPEPPGAKGDVSVIGTAPIVRSVTAQSLTTPVLFRFDPPDVTAVYDRHSYDAEKQEALVAWGEKVAALAAARTSGNG